VFLPPRGNIASNVAALQRREMVLGAIPRIRRELPSLSAPVRVDGRQHRLELGRVAGLVREPLRHHHLMRGIDGRLGVIALDASVPRLHDADLLVGACKILVQQLVNGMSGVMPSRREYMLEMPAHLAL